MQLDFGGPVYNETNQDILFLRFIDRFSRFPSAEVCEHGNANGIEQILQNYILLYDIPRRIRLNQACCQVGSWISNFCEQQNIEIIEEPINDQRAIRLVERLV